MRLVAGSLLALVLLTGCATEDDKASPVYRTELTVDELMHLVLEPSADVLWDSAGFVLTVEGETSLAPTTEEGWFAVESAAGVVAESGNLLLLPERALQRSDWIRFTNEMVDAAQDARTAALELDDARLFQAGADLYQSCVKCHTKYWTMQDEVE